MAAIPNTVRRGGVYHFRRGVPTRLKGLFNLGELTCSLQTSDPATARRLSRWMYLGSEELFGIVKDGLMLTDHDIAALVKDFYATILSRDDQARLESDEPASENVRTARIDHYKQLAERSRIDLASNAFGSVRTITDAMIARRYGMKMQFDKPDVRKLEQAMLRAGIEVAEALRARAEGDFNYEPADKLLVAALREIEVSLSASRSIKSDLPTIAPGPQFSETASTLREAQLRRGVWERQTYLQARATFELFVKFAEDRPVAHYVRADAGRFKSLLEDLPANYGKAAAYRALSPQQIIDQTRDAALVRLSPRTVQRHFAALSALWESALEQGLVTVNIFADWKFTAAKRARDQRQMWSSAELGALFATPVWSGCLSVHRRSKPGDILLRDEKLLIAAEK